MKHLLLAISWLLASVVLSAQTQQHRQMLATSDTLMSFSRASDSVVRYLIADDDADTTEGGNVSAFHRWSRFMEDRVCTNAPFGTDRLVPANIAMRSYLENYGALCQNSGTLTANWNCLGPFIKHVQERSGRIDALWVHPDSTDIILAGATSGGLWKTIDGGLHWFNLTDNSPDVLAGTTGAMRIAVDPPIWFKFSAA